MEKAEKSLIKKRSGDNCLNHNTIVKEYNFNIYLGIFTKGSLPKKVK